MKSKVGVIAGILVIGFVFFSCETNKDVTESGFNVTAKGTPNGIELNIDNIPENATHFSVFLYDITANDQLYTGAGFQGNELEQLRKTSFLICPFVKNRHEYQITIDSFILTKENMKTINSVTITAVANGGIHIINNPTLVWNNINNFSTLSERPIFSDEKINSQNIVFSYGLVFKSEETSGSASAGFFGLTNELTFDNTENYNSIVEMIGNIGLTGDISMYADVDLTIEYGKIPWTIVFAKSEDKNLRLKL
jgi:hypothetical protein